MAFLAAANLAAIALPNGLTRSLGFGGGGVGLNKCEIVIVPISLP